MVYIWVLSIGVWLGTASGLKVPAQQPTAAEQPNAAAEQPIAVIDFAETEVVQKEIERMLAAPNEIEVQTSGCAALAKHITGPEKMRAFEAMSMAALRTLDTKDVALSCLEPLENLVQSNLFEKNANLWVYSTSGMKALIELWRRHPDDKQLRWDTSSIIGGTYGVGPQHTALVSKLGGFEELFETLRHFSSDPDLQMQIYRSLSDPSFTSVGADAIANAGGPFNGIKFLVEEMKSHPQPRLAESPTDHLDLLYEIMQVSAGILFSGNRSFHEKFVEDDFLDQIVYAMSAEPDLRGTNDVACKCMSKLTEIVPYLTVQKLLVRGVVGHIRDALENFKFYDPTPFGPSHTLGNEYPVWPYCVKTLRNMNHFSGSAIALEMQRVNMKKVFQEMRPGLALGTETLGRPVQVLDLILAIDVLGQRKH